MSLWSVWRLQHGLSLVTDVEPQAQRVTGRSRALVAGIYLKVCCEILQSWASLQVHDELASSWQSGQWQKPFEVYELG